MLKGHVFSKQLFGNPIFALFINTFLNGRNGVSNNYKNGMNVTYSGSSLTIDSGAICIQGRFLEEDSYTSISAGTDTAYCKLVLEIDLDKQNTESEFNQADYKVVKSSSGYPSLTQSNIVKNNSGVYQYELARFKTGANGISDFSDKRTFLDFTSIYDAMENEYNSFLEQLKQELASVENGSAYVLKKDIDVKVSQVTLENTSSGIKVYMQFKRTGNIVFVKSNIYVPGGIDADSKNFLISDVIPDFAKTNEHFKANSSKLCYFSENISGVQVKTSISSNPNASGKYVYTYSLYRTDTSSEAILETFMSYVVDDEVITESDYILGDVNGDGNVDAKDLQMVQDYMMDYISLTDKQFKLADMNADGVIDTGDTYLLSKKINS